MSIIPNPSQTAVLELVVRLADQPPGDVADALLFAGAAALHKCGLPAIHIDMILSVIREVAEHGPARR